MQEDSKSSLKGVTICLDVDGVLADISDLNIPYAKRKAYPGIAKRVQDLKNRGAKIVIQTARYMFKCYGDQQKAHERGYNELLVWLEQNSIPYDQVYLGKVPADIYVDDRGCRVESVHGDKDWNGHFADVLEETQEKLKNANI